MTSTYAGARTRPNIRPGLTPAVTRNGGSPSLDKVTKVVGELRKLGDQANDDAVNAISSEAEEWFGGKASAFYRSADLVEAKLASYPSA